MNIRMTFLLLDLLYINDRIIVLFGLIDQPRVLLRLDDKLVLVNHIVHSRADNVDRIVLIKVGDLGGVYKILNCKV